MLAEQWEKQVTSYLDGDRALLARIAAVLPVGMCKKCRVNRSCDNHVMYQLKLRSLRNTLGVILGLYIYKRSG